jgi:two-component system LytT family response regulator
LPAGKLCVPEPQHAPLRVVIVDDEPLVRDGLRGMLADEPGMHVVGEACDGSDAIALIEAERPDIVFLDVQMPEQDGFSVLEAIGDPPVPAVIFVTAYDQYAIRAFDIHAADYLLKPFDEGRFRIALERVRARLASVRAPCTSTDVAGSHSATEVQLLLAELQRRDRYADRLLVKGDGRVLVVQAGDIDWIEAADNYVRLHTSRRTHLMREPIKTLEQRLDPRRFVRVHRSAIVNVARIEELRPLPSGELSIVLVSGERLPLGRRFRAAFMTRFGATTED